MLIASPKTSFAWSVGIGGGTMSRGRKNGAARVGTVGVASGRVGANAGASGGIPANVSRESWGKAEGKECCGCKVVAEFTSYIA
jgi:hypothetical protein